MLSFASSPKFRYPLLICLAILFVVAFRPTDSGDSENWSGAYADYSNKDTSFVILIANNYFSYSAFSKDLKRFYFTWGGPLQEHNEQWTIPVEFNSADKQAVGHMLSIDVQKKPAGIDFFDHHYQKITAAPSDLMGCWRIAGRMQNGTMQPMQLGARRTLKLLTQNRFQWIAINIETGEFSGTGGGTYTLKDGVYTENIEFFSRDSSRVGQSLSFEGKVKEKQWFHSGKSSRGEPINEVWVPLQ